jgi:hypothetical protein
MDTTKIKQELLQLLSTHPRYRVQADTTRIFDEINGLLGHDYSSVMRQAAEAEILGVPAMRFFDTAYNDMGDITLTGITLYLQKTAPKDWDAHFLSLILNSECVLTHRVADNAVQDCEYTIDDLNQFLKNASISDASLAPAAQKFLMRVFSSKHLIFRALCNFDMHGLDRSKWLDKLFKGMLQQARHGIFLSDFWPLEPENKAEN